MRHNQKVIFILISVFFLLFLPSLTYASIRFQLEQPAGPFSQGQEVSFVINIDTQGASVRTATIQANYDPNYLEFVTVRPGNTFSTVTATPLSNTDGGKRWLTITGTSSTDFSGSGVFAYYVLKIIAQTSGSTEICDITEVSPTPVPTTAIQPTTSTYVPPTVAPPVTGDSAPGNRNILIGSILIVAASTIFMTLNIKHRSFYHKSKSLLNRKR